MHGVLKEGVYTKKEDDQQQLRLGGNSWTINLTDLPETAQVIEYITPTTSWAISREDAFEHGFMRILGGEEKLIVPLKWWTEGAVAIND